QTLGNVITGNDGDGILLVGDGFGTANQIQGNFIGTSVDGMQPIGNGRNGIEVRDASQTQIGGDVNSLGNIVSDNSYGIYLRGSSDGSQIQGNFVGVNLDGAGGGAFGNNSGGIVVIGASNVTIGGPANGGLGNVVSNDLNRSGIYLSNSS